MLITVHEQLGHQPTHHNQVAVVIPQWIDRVLETFQLPKSAAIDYKTLSQYASQKDLTDYVLMLLETRNYFEREYGLFDQTCDALSHDYTGARIALEHPFHLNDCMELFGSNQGHTHSEVHDMMYDQKATQELFWGAPVNEHSEIEWQICDLGYRYPDDGHAQNMNHVIGIVAHRLIYVADYEQRQGVRQQLRRDLLSHCFNSGVSLETLARSGLMDRYILQCY